MKYVAKGLCPNDDDPDYDYVLHGKQYKLKFSPKQLLFNSLLKKTKTRLWGASRNFSKIMAPLKTIRPNWHCTSVIQNRNGEFVNMIWDSESGIRPETVKILKPLVIKGREVVYPDMKAIDFVEPVTHFKFRRFEFKEIGGCIHVFEPFWVTAEEAVKGGFKTPI